MDSTQLIKGILEGCVLEIIAKKETYGYEILAQLSEFGFEELKEGTLYPILTRLNKNEYIKYRKEKSPLGPIRKYYFITETGMEYLKAFKNDYKQVIQSANIVLFGSED